LFLFASLFLLQFFVELCVYLKKSFQLILTNTIKAHLYGSVGPVCSIPLFGVSSFSRFQPS
jgi:hypothetical protein